MSNQVYSNQQRKYVPIPGLNTYVNDVAVPIPVRVSGNGAATIPSVTPIPATTASLEQVPGFTSFSPITGRLTIDVEGVYSIGVRLDVQGAPAADTVDIDGLASLIIRDTGDGNEGSSLDSMSIKAAAPGAGTPGNIHREFSLHYVGFLKVGSSLEISYANYSNTLAVVPIAAANWRVGKFI